MKHSAMAAAAFMLSFVMVCPSCTRSEEPEETARTSIHIAWPDSMETATQTITFRCVGDYDLSTKPFGTRSLTADGKTMTDLWVLDYMGDELTQTIHQTSDDADFGAPSIELDYGSHTLYFVASRGSGATIDTEAKTITFSRVLDTFWQNLSLTVTSSSDANRTVTLSRVVTKLTAVITDAIPTDAAVFNISPSQWYYGIDYTNGEPAAATASQTITINIPASEIGVTNEHVNVYGFSWATEWTTDVSLTCKTSGGAILGQAEISAAPFKRNRVTVYTGPLFDKTRSMTLTLNDTWDDSYQATW